MSTVIRYEGHPSGYIDFYMGEETIFCEETIDILTAQQLLDAALDIEDEQLAQSYKGIVSGAGKSLLDPNTGDSSGLVVTFLRNWLITTGKTSGTLIVKNGTVVNAVKGLDIFVDPFPNNVRPLNLPEANGVILNLGDVFDKVWHGKNLS
ncbi:MAG: hypothetical protein KZQ83_14920 [gamma proteobacterium symbiont of Taylorina sp.]|nr:hypothetical protein [gamma proteobacterium symbiont of Taylorina sp.]